MIDLHVHSIYSDGCDTPAELVKLALSSGVKALALTDHDTTDGVEDFILACKEASLPGIVGVELSAHVSSGTLHILGLGFNPSDKPLMDALVRIRNSREERNHRILEKLNQLGVALTWEEVQSFAGDEVVGRPHFAQAMIARGMAESVAEVFERFLQKGAPAYVDRFRPSPAECVELIRNAGGIPVVAHPLSWEYDIPALEAGLLELKEAGLLAIEAYHSSHSGGDVVELLRLANKHKFLVTGGSDYHGSAVKPNVRLGLGNGSTPAPDSLLPSLIPYMAPEGYLFGKEVLA